jgi:hypothetical protein
MVRVEIQERETDHVRYRSLPYRQCDDRFVCVVRAQAPNQIFV